MHDVPQLEVNVQQNPILAIPGEFTGRFELIDWPFDKAGW